MTIQLGAVAVGGMLGAMLRYGLSLFIPSLGNFPLSTFLINVVGCFTMGYLVASFDRNLGSETWRLFLCTGLLGGFTTFSTFGLEVFALLRNSQVGMALFYALASCGLCVLAVGGGFLIASR